MIELALDIDPELRYLYEKALSEVSTLDVNTPDNCLSAKEVVRAHFLIADYFLGQGDGIGGIGMRDSSLLVSAVSRQWVGFDNLLKWRSVHERAATLLFGLVHNHAFHDANKRTAFLSTAHYLLKNSFMLTKSERELENFTVEIAERKLGRYRRYQNYLRDGDSDPEVRYIHWYLKKYSRRVEHNHHTITYRDLDSALKSFNCFLSEPGGNRISVYRKVVRRKFFGKGIKEEDVRVCRIGFPGWSKQVNRGVLKFLRNQLELTTEHGVDSAAFFKDADDMRSLIALYEGALQRLAYR